MSAWSLSESSSFVGLRQAASKLFPVTVVAFVALIILYSITGIITALFLLIIVTGAIRAHRHPERYGPRATARFGRPRQSRAKGLARAVLDTIPIVRFGGPSSEPPEVPKPTEDLEMQDGNAMPEPAPDAEAATTGEASVVGPAEREGGEGGAGSNESENAETDSIAAGTVPLTTTKTTEEALSSQKRCPVCMEDFTQGEELRMLPCHHHFHPDCIDPWLLNVSGSCPLCRIDLHPEQEADGEGEAGAGENAGSANDDANEPLPAQQQQQHHDGSRLSRYLHLARRTSGEERMAALRQLREESRARNRNRRSRIIPELGISRLGRAISRRNQQQPEG
ncbi:hypothetical protein FN846DRAFT_900949 [Sphaerosporella brunnea]|uniref:RING-type domain-containing protein n=1 Tax=Sphaerosporella brunnea TaxID=1250544 RepID=A0A5J5EH86_9PEZI|nr:hypothetical protein FN846DRAFT_900949 [Sphaerosporella brunnea]